MQLEDKSPVLAADEVILHLQQLPLVHGVLDEARGDGRTRPDGLRTLGDDVDHLATHRRTRELIGTMTKQKA